MLKEIGENERLFWAILTLCLLVLIAYITLFQQPTIKYVSEKEIEIQIQAKEQQALLEREKELYKQMSLPFIITYEKGEFPCSNYGMPEYLTGQETDAAWEAMRNGYKSTNRTFSSVKIDHNDWRCNRGDLGYNNNTCYCKKVR